MKKFLIFIILLSFMFANSDKLNLNPVITYQDYIIKQAEKKEKKKVIATHIIGSSVMAFLTGFAIYSCKQMPVKRF